MSLRSPALAVPLTQRSVAGLKSRATIPEYDRSGLTSGIVHVGVGGFNRSHLAVYLDDLLQTSQTGGWGEFGIGLLPPDLDLHDALAAQDCLYGVLERDAGHANYRIIGSLTGHVYAPAAQREVIERMASPECKIISLTVTEGGYFLDDASGKFLAGAGAIQHDLENAGAPTTWLGYVAAAASRRMQQGLPFTLLSCDNLQSNGDTARKALLSFAALRDGKLQAWMEANVSFPNSMVDRITPRTTAADRGFIAEHCGVRDLAPVVTEPFRQWVLEDNFVAGRPAFEQVGVQVTSDVAPYERTKMGLLNGGHFCIAYCAALLGIPTVADAVEDEQIHLLLERFLAEVRTTLHDLPGIDLDEYIATILRRFANPAIGDQISRICSDGSAKITKFILPTLRDLLIADASPEIIPLVIASWLRYQRGITEDERVLAVIDPGASMLAPFVAAGADSAALAMSLRPIFGDIGNQFPSLVLAVQQQLDNFRRLGVRATLAQALGPRIEESQ
jgi:mannitol 2-dehydrogenase